MIRLNCFISVKPENRAEVLSLAKELTALSLKENGCKGYDIFESSTRPDVLMFCESWTDEEALKAHSASEHFGRLVGAIEKLAELHLEKFVR